MREFCSRIVARAGKMWAETGWWLFLSWLLLPLLLGASHGAVVAFLLLAVLLALWWLIDVVDQQLPVWQVAVGVAMLAVSVLPRGGFLFLACWVIYWTKVRE